MHVKANNFPHSGHSERMLDTRHCWWTQEKKEQTFAEASESSLYTKRTPQLDKYILKFSLIVKEMHVIREKQKDTIFEGK